MNLNVKICELKCFQAVRLSVHPWCLIYRAACLERRTSEQSDACTSAPSAARTIHSTANSQVQFAKETHVGLITWLLLTWVKHTLNAKLDLDCTFLGEKLFAMRNAAELFLCCMQCLPMNRTAGLTCLCLTFRSYHMCLSLKKCWKINSGLTAWFARILSATEVLHIPVAMASPVLQLSCCPPSLMTPVQGISSGMTLR